MKSSKKLKEKGEQPSIQGSISKSLIGGKKYSKSSGGQHQKRAAGKYVQSIRCENLPQRGNYNAVKDSDIKLEDEIKPFSSQKIVLQLFPIDKKLQMGLEKDGHNPFLELTLSARKKISSVLKHLYNKWGSSSVAAMGELMLFPFNIPENLNSCRKWSSSDIGNTAGDVYAVLGSPKLFRLRYGWVSFQPNTSPSCCTKLGQEENVCCHAMDGSLNTKKDADGTELEPCDENETTDVAVWQKFPTEPLVQEVHKNQKEVKSEDFKPNACNKLENDTAAEENSSAAPFNSEELRLDTGISMTSLMWSDISNISIGGLLSEASLQEIFKTEEQRSGGSRLVSQPAVADSLDAFIAQVKHQYASTNLSPEMPSSILDAESTCHSFAFSKLSSSSIDLSTPGQSPFTGISENYRNTAFEPYKLPKPEVNAQGSVFGINNVQEPKMDPLPSSLGVYNNENSLGLSSLKWNDSLGPFDLPLTSRQIIKDDSLSIGGFVR